MSISVKQLKKQHFEIIPRDSDLSGVKASQGCYVSTYNQMKNVCIELITFMKDDDQLFFHKTDIDSLPCMYAKRNSSFILRVQDNYDGTLTFEYSDLKYNKQKSIVGDQDRCVSWFKNVLLDGEVVLENI